VLGTLEQETTGSVPEEEPVTGGPPGEDPVLTTGRLVTMCLVAGPIVGLALILMLGWGRSVGLWVIGTGVVLYLFTGFGISIGFHRLFTHHSFKANRPLKVVCAIAGSMALEGSVISWVAIHRRHHMFGDQPGDPHSPYKYGTSAGGVVRGFLWSHVAWLFAADTTDAKRFAPDLQRDRDLVIIDRLFPVLAVVSLAIPFVIGWTAYGTLRGGLTVLLWAGLVRFCLLHHVTWSINSVCHLWGGRPFVTNDRSANVATLAVVSFGESWHNFHHAAPSSARHGVLKYQFDPSARLISLLEQVGWAAKVRWPNAAQIAELTKPGQAERSPAGWQRRLLATRAKLATS
jgi:stearoyl-CoA desaturase (Delta-9 desaturase)